MKIITNSKNTRPLIRQGETKGGPITFGLQRVGENLRHVYSRIIQVPPKAVRAVNELRLLHELLTVVQCHLEARMYNEHGSEGSFAVYFGPRHFHQGK